MSNYIKELPKDAVQVKGALNWIDTQGNLYGIETRIIPLKDGSIAKHGHYGDFFKYTLFTNNHNGYVYGPIKYIVDEEKNKYEVRQRRIHIIVATAFLENPNNLPIVGHKNNIKSDNRVSNLYWTTWQENTKKAFDDGLEANDKSYDDSQSNPVVMFDTYSNEEIAKFGSICEASRLTNISKNTISRQARYKKPVRKPYYFRFADEADRYRPTIVVQYDFDTDEEINRFFNTGEASRKTGVNPKTILDQCHKDKKPKWTKEGFYFRYKKP